MSDRSVADTLAAESIGAVSVAPPPTLAGRYRLLSLLGVGGMGSVYRARDAELEEDVALKVLHRASLGAPEVLARFRQEVKLARRVTHRNVARTFDIGEHDGEKFLTMEFVDGESLTALLRRRGPLPIDEALAISKQLCAGLAAAHAVGVVHRDLKPDNILVAPDGRVVITDFGIALARLDEGATGPIGVLAGTPAYMAPEQVQAIPDIDQRADLYALGEVIYELMTGERAWPGEVPLVVAMARLTTDPPDPRALRADAPGSLADVVLACLARRRDDRPTNADAVAAALEAVDAIRSAPFATAPLLSVPSPDDRAVAVLHFKNLGPPADEFVAAGLTEDLLDALAMTRGLKVRSHSASAATDAREVGRTLGVDVVIEGSVRRAGERLRINARLISVADGFHLWSQRFDRAFTDLLAVNDEAVQAIATALSAQHVAPTRAASSDPVAIELYLRALQQGNNPDGRVGWDLLEQALARAPDDPAILSANAVSLPQRAFLGGPNALDHLARARELANRALELAPHLAEPWVALAHVRFNDDDPPGAAGALRRALRAGPSLATAHELAGRILVEVGLLTEGLAHLERAQWLEPSASRAQDIIRGFQLQGEIARSDAARAALAEPLASHVLLLLTTVRMAMWRHEPLLVVPSAPNAQPRMREMLEVLVSIVQTRALSPESLAFFDNTIASTPPHSRPRRLFLQIKTEILAFADRIDEADRAMHEAVDSGLLDVTWMDFCPLLSPLRERPSFVPLRARVAERAARVIEAWRAGGES